MLLILAAAVIMTACIIASAGIRVSAEEAESAPLKAELAADSKTAQSGHVTTLIGSAEGGTGPYTYSFAVKDNESGSTYKFCDYRTENKLYWTPTLEGIKTITVSVKDSAGNVSTASKEVTVKSGMSVSFSSSCGKALASRGWTTLNAYAAGGMGGYTYKFTVYNSETDDSYCIKECSETSSWAWFTSGAAEKVLYCDAYDSVGNHVRKTLDVTVSDITGLLACDQDACSLRQKQDRLLTAYVYGGSGHYTYKFIVYNVRTGQWYRIRDFENSNNVYWYTGPAGVKKLYVDVKDRDGSVFRIPLDVVVK